jgi:hypothetical protein
MQVATFVNLFPLGAVMSSSDWQALYSAALAESDPRKLSGRIEAARQAIYDRMKEIDNGSREHEQLDRALHALFTLPTRRRTA